MPSQGAKRFIIDINQSVTYYFTNLNATPASHLLVIE
jgi:hypothetical protein